MKFYENHTERISFPMTSQWRHCSSHCSTQWKQELVEYLLDHILGLKNNGSSPQWAFHPFDELAPLRSQNNYGNTVLLVAASDGSIKMVKLLLRHDVGLLEVKNNRGETPLFKAAAFGMTEVVSFLASKVKDMGANLRRHDTTPILHIAVLGRYFGNVLHMALNIYAFLNIVTVFPITTKTKMF